MEPYLNTYTYPNCKKITKIKISDVLKKVILKSIPSIIDIKFLECEYDMYNAFTSPTYYEPETMVSITVKVSLTIDPFLSGGNSKTWFMDEIKKMFDFTHPEMSDYVRLVVGEIIYEEKPRRTKADEKMGLFLSVFGVSP